MLYGDTLFAFLLPAPDFRLNRLQRETDQAASNIALGGIFGKRVVGTKQRCAYDILRVQCPGREIPACFHHGEHVADNVVELFEMRVDQGEKPLTILI
jgi:hypothetical protein